MTQDQYLQAALAMEREGGSFASRLAMAYYAADGTNQRKILEAFGDLFEKHYRVFCQGEDDTI